MQSELSKACRERVLNVDDTGPHHAVLAVLDKCDAMRAETENVSGGVGGFLADEFEGVIAHALGIEA